jgi:pyrroline-5-carboxylate reductase
MGGAMLEGWLTQGIAADTVTVIDPNLDGASAEMWASRGIGHRVDAGGLPPAQVLVLAVKPQMLTEVAAGIGQIVSDETLVVSILAGKTIADLARAFPAARVIVRAMPNLPASIGRGATGAFAGDGMSSQQRDLAHALLAGIGIVEWVGAEADIDAVTALSGSGPAYVFHLVECMAQAGIAAGLEAALARRLARETVTGAAALLAASDLDPEILRRNVTSPGGTTAAALDILMGEGGLAELMTRAVAAAKRRAGELSG